MCYSKAKLAAACAGIIYFITYVPYMYVAIREEAAGDKIAAWAKSLAVGRMSWFLFACLDGKYFIFHYCFCKCKASLDVDVSMKCVSLYIDLVHRL